MAPNKKKKKPASNPARGFATTSMASKAKNQAINDTEHDDSSGVPDQAADSLLEDGGVRLSGAPAKEPDKDLQDLTPEELELQLENSTLQILLDSCGEKAKKDVSRQVSRLRTERRLLRSQAEHLNTRQWLPSEIMRLIMDLLEVQTKDSDGRNYELEASKSICAISEDDMLVKLWALKRLLPQLGLSAHMTDLSLRNLLTKQRDPESQISSACKDSIWGLDECLNWLAFAAAPEDLPSFESRDDSRQIDSSNIRHSEGFVEADAQLSTTPDSRPSTPISRATLGPQSSLDEASSVSSRSESDNDFEPEQQVIKYLALKSQLYEINPELAEVNPKKQKRKTTKSRNIKADQAQDADRRISRLTTRLKKIKSDILFDEDEANRRWVEIHFDLAKDTAERKRLDIVNDQGQETRIESSVGRTNGIKAVEQNEDAGEMLGELFFGLPDTTTNLSTGASHLTTTDTGSTTIEVRDFGKWTGMSPRRVFEEACKARDSSSRVTYKLIFSSTVSKRHSLEVCWSRNQSSTPPSPLDSFAYVYDPRRFMISMMSTACPDAMQSEAYISTVALFLIFASSPKEEKAYLRLPAIWRDFWMELARTRKEETDIEDKNVLRELRSLIEKGDRKDLDETAGDPTSSIDEGASNRGTTQSEAPEAVKIASTILPNETKQTWTAKVSTASYQIMLMSRMNLPIWQFKDELLQAIEEHQVIIVCGETGCGKSTQVPSFIMEHELSGGRPCKVYCTEPRRISAISLARRVSEELGEGKGDVGTFRSLVGYAIRLESQVTTQTRLVYVTTGIVMRMLERSDDLGDLTHLVLDEVHERSIDSDFLLIVLRKLLLRRPDLKVVLMSATVDAQRFSRYLDQAPIFNVPGRTFQVETRYLEDAIETTRFNAETASSGVFDDDEDLARDSYAKTSLSVDNLRYYSPDTCNTLLQLDEYRISYDLIIRLLEVIATDEEYTNYSNAILIFLPGIAEIKRLNDMLVGHSIFVHGWYIYPLHSTIATEEQERAFLVPPPGYRKIVLATNIAETGITIPDVTCVIDTGKHKEMRFDERRQLSRLIEAFISRANAKQRRGRAGRVRKGLCFHLFTKERHDKIMPEEQTPEMLRLSLQDLVLRVKICKLGGIEQTLSEALDPPSTKNIRRAIDSLVDVRALTNAEDLTPLGRQLARLPLDVFLGKLILLGSIFGCLDAMLTIAAILSSKSPFSAPMGMRSQADVARLAFRKGDSDLLTVYNAYCAWRRICTSTTGMSEYQFCRKNFLSQQTLSNVEDLKAQLTTALVDAGFMKLDDPEKASLNGVRFYSRKRNFVEIPNRHNMNSDSDLVLNSVIAWSFYPKLLRREGNGWRNIANNQAVSLHPTSVNKGMDRPPHWLSFYHIMQSSNKFYNAHETSPVEQFALALVCGEAEFKIYSGVMVIDGNRIRFSFDEWKTMIAIKSLRTQIRSIMAQSFRNPGRGLSSHQQAWLAIWQKIFEHATKKS